MPGLLTADGNNDKYRKYIAYIIYMHRILSFWHENVGWNLKLGVPQWLYNNAGSNNITHFWDFFKEHINIVCLREGRNPILGREAWTKSEVLSRASMVWGGGSVSSFPENFWKIEVQTVHPGVYPAGPGSNDIQFLPKFSVSKIEGSYISCHNLAELRPRTEDFSPKYLPMIPLTFSRGQTWKTRCRWGEIGKLGVEMIPSGVHVYQKTLVFPGFG